MQRLMRAAVGTNNIDNCSRVCHSPTSFALRKSFGLSGATGSFTDIDHADVAMLIGVNPTQGHPVVGARIKQAALRGCKLVTIDPRRIELADYGVLHLAPRPGTNAAVALGPGARRASRRADSTQDFIAERTEGYEAARGAARVLHARGGRGDHRDPGRRPRRGSPHLRGGQRRLDPLGPRRHRAQVRLRGRAAALQPGHDDRQGRQARLGAAAAARPEQRPGLVGHGRAARHLHRLPPRRSTRRPPSCFEEAWGVPLSRTVGYKIPEMFDAAVAGDLKAMYIFGEDVAQTDPDTAHVISGAGEPRVPRLPGDLRERDHQVRGRDPARLGVPGEGRDVHQRRAALPARRGRDRSARRRADRLRHHHHGLAHARPRDGLAIPVGRPGRDRAADPALRAA